jgi:hypothetical protein
MTGHHAARADEAGVAGGGRAAGRPHGADDSQPAGAVL